jgi:hypothetical protein
MEAESDDRFENLAKDFNFANLYKTIYETVWTDQVRSQKNSVDRLLNYLNEKWCSVNQQDLSRIFYWLDFWQYKFFVNKIDSLSWKQLKETCEKVVKCLNKDVNYENTMGLYRLCYYCRW